MKRYSGYFILLAVMIAGSISIVYSQKALDTNVAEAEEVARPAEIELTLLTVPDCEDCFNAELVIDALKKENVKILKLDKVDYNSDKGRDLIALHNVTKVPTVLISGEIEKENIAPFLSKYLTEEVNDVAVWTQVTPVYIDASTEEIIGRVSMTLLTDKSCGTCYDPAEHKAILERNFRVNFSDGQTLDINSREGSELVSDYDITNVPTILLSSDAKAYPSLVSAWNTVGTIEQDGTFVFKKLDALSDIIYKNLNTGEIIDTKKKE